MRENDRSRVEKIRPLIVYYSYSGITRRLAEDLALLTDGDLRDTKLKP